MDITQYTQNGLHHLIQVMIKACDIEKKVNEKLNQLSKTVRMDGFRPGKVPTDLIEKKYKQSTYYEILDDLVHEAVHKAIEHTKTSPSLTPRVDFKPAEMGKDQLVQIEFDAIPDFEMGDLKSLEFKEFKPQISDEKVGEFLKKIAFHAQEKNMETVDRPAREGDAVVLDFSGTVDGQSREGMNGKGVRLRLGSGDFVPGFENQLLGCKAHSEKDVVVTFPQDYIEDLKGKEALFKVKVLEVLGAGEISLDDDFAKKEGFETLEEFKNSIKDHLEKAYGQVAWGRSKKPILDVLSESYKFPVPNSMVDEEFNHIWSLFQKQVQEHSSEEDSKEDSFSSEEEEKIKAKYKEIADRRVRLGFLLSKIADVYKVNVTEDDLNQEVWNVLQQNPNLDPQKVLKFYEKNPKAVQSMKSQILENKVLKKVLEEARVNVVYLTPEQLDKEPEIDPQEVLGL